MRYNEHFSYRKRKRFLRFLRVVLLLLIVGIIGGIVYILRDNLTSSNFNSIEQSTSDTTSSYVAPSVQIFRAPYFQFQANRTWSEDTNNSRDGRYVYKSLRNGLIEHQLTVYVNNPPSNDLAATRVMIVAPTSNHALKAVQVSEHCGKSFNFSGSRQIVTLDQVSFNCFRDDTRYTMFAGFAGGTTSMSLLRPDGSQAVYTIYYSNVTATPDSIQFEEIMNSFQTR